MPANDTLELSRDIRQRELIPPDKLSTTKATVVGVGAIGRQVAMQLAAIGVSHLSLVDYDVVGVENLGPQGFNECDVGLPKVTSVSQTCQAINPSVVVTTANRKFRAIQFTGGVFFCCVDGIETRASIFRQIMSRTNLFVDGRMSAEYLRVLVAHDEQSVKHYETTLFSAGEAYQGPCTSKSTIYCSNIAAGLMVAQFAKWLRGCQLDNEVDFNILTNEAGTS